MTVTDALIDFALDDVRPSVRAAAIVRYSTYDWAACGIAGMAEGTFTRWANGQAAAGFAPTFTGHDLTAPTAALVNGTLSHALDFDDTHFGHIGHPSVVVVPAVLAAKPVDWADFQTAILVGIEASIRVGLYLGRDHYQRGFHQTATAGAFGACLGACRAMRLTRAQTRAAVGLCATMASGLKVQFGTMGKPLNAGLAARAGYEAARWAWSGMTGPERGIEGFAKAHDAACDATALDGLGRDWHTDTLSHKFHACCHGLHAALEALGDVTGPDVDHIEVHTHPRWMSVCNVPAPETGLAAKFSYRHVIAMQLLGHSTGDIASFTDENAMDGGHGALRAKIDVRAADDLSETQARVHVTQRGVKRMFTHDLAEPLPLDLLGAKLRTKTQLLIGAERADGLWGIDDVAAFSAALAP